MYNIYVKDEENRMSIYVCNYRSEASLLHYLFVQNRYTILVIFHNRILSEFSNCLYWEDFIKGIKTNE